MTKGSNLPSQEKKWIHQLKAGEPDAWQRLCEEYGEALFLYAYHRCGQNPTTADEIRQETLVAAVSAIQQFRGDAPLFGWLCRIARHKTADHIRRGIHEGPSLDEQFTDDNNPWNEWNELISREILPEEILIQSETRAAVVEALWRLPSDQRGVLIDRYIRSLTVDEISKRTGRTYKAAESLLSRSRDALKAQLKEVFTNV